MSRKLGRDASTDEREMEAHLQTVGVSRSESVPLLSKEDISLGNVRVDQSPFGAVVLQVQL